MNLVLILREEIVSLVILLYFWCYSTWFSKGIDMRKYSLLCFVAIVHVLMDIITVIIVNYENIPFAANTLLHLIFYYSAVLYCIIFLSYTLTWVTTEANKKRWLSICFTIFLLYVISGPFLGIEIRVGNGTFYSWGPAVIIGYSIAYIFSLISVILLVVNIRKLDKNIIFSLLPISFVFMVFITLQVFIPEFLFTGAALTVITIGMFFAIENPSKLYMRKAFIDADTGAKNRTCFEEDFSRYKSKLLRKNDFTCKIGIVVCNLNGLKLINDTYGHSVGDKMIRNATHIMQGEFKHANDVYRVGGDEFVAIYSDISCDEIENDIRRVEEACLIESGKHQYPLSIAIGYATSDISRNLDEIHNIADANMYKRKMEMKAENPALVRA